MTQYSIQQVMPDGIGPVPLVLLAHLEFTCRQLVFFFFLFVGFGFIIFYLDCKWSNPINVRIKIIKIFCFLNVLRKTIWKKK